MISLKSHSSALHSAPGLSGATIHNPHLPIWFDRFRTTEEPDSDLEFEPADINYPSELRCPNCDQFSADSICICGATIQHPNTGELP